MTPLPTFVLLACLAVWLGLILLDFVRTRRIRRLVLEASCLFAVFLFLRWTTGFPEPADRRSFGTGSVSLGFVGLMFLCIMLGMAARHFFYLRGKFSWLPLVRPLCVSPIVLLPLLGALQGAASFEPIQVLSFCLLAFQNGFFWRVVFERAQATLQS